MNKRYQIFISSTYEDLIKEREKVTQAILKLYNFPIGMEMFHADNEEQWAQIKNTIDMSDYYVLIVGRYCGTLIEKEGISYTEKEYDYALSKGIPVLSFVISDEAKKESYGVETNKQQKALRKFVKKVKKLPCEFWTTPDELAYQVTSTLSIKISENNRVGWIKNDFENIFNVFYKNILLFDEDKIDNLFRKVMYMKLLGNNTAIPDITTSTNNLIENQLMHLDLQKESMNFYIKSLNRDIRIELYDEYIEIDTSIQCVFNGVPNTDTYSFFPWLLPGIEQDSYDFDFVKYNSINNLEYIKRGVFIPTPNESYVFGGIGIVIPYDKDKTKHNITFRSKYRTEYARFFHSYGFKKFCEHFNLSARLDDYRKEKKRYVCTKMGNVYAKSRLCF